VRNTVPGDVVIKDAGVGGTMKIPADTVLFYGNPYYSLVEHYKNSESVAYWNKLIAAQLEDSKYAKIGIANSDFSASDATRNGCKVDKIIPNGVDVNFYFDNGSTRRGLLWCGSRHEIKNHAETEKFKNVTSIFREDGHTKEEMREAYRHAEFLLITSPIEGCCNVAFEAMACGTPILTTRSGWFYSNPIEDAGILLDCFTETRAKFDPRGYILRHGLTADEYTRKVREAVCE
jgi:hypothetical protein